MFIFSKIQLVSELSWSSYKLATKTMFLTSLHCDSFVATWLFLQLGKRD